MPPNQSPQNLGLALAQMGQGGMTPFGQSQLDPQQLRGMQPPAPASYAYQPQQSQMSMMQLSPTSTTSVMPNMQQQPNPWGSVMSSVAQNFNKINQQNQNQSQNNSDQDGQLDYGNMNSYGPGMFGY